VKQIGRQMLYFGEQELAAIMLSIKVAIWATFLSLPLAVWVAFLLVRRRFWGREILNVLVHLPLIMPPVVTGYLLLMLFGRTGVVGQVLSEYFGITLAFRWTGAVLASAIMAFPLVVRAVRLSIEQINPELEHVALTLGGATFDRIINGYDPHGATWHFGWCGFRFCKSFRGIWRNHYVCWQYPKSNTDGSLSHIWIFADARQRTRSVHPRIYIGVHFDNCTFVI
jgi:ABC-type phosphate/phosphonate transport system permease subunit